MVTIRQRWSQTNRSINAFLDTPRIRNLSIRWFISDWRAGLFFLVIALFLPQLLSSQALLSVTITIGVYVMLASGLNVVVGFAGLLDLGYVAFFAIGSYVAAIFTGGVINGLDGKIHFLPSYPYWIIIPLGVAIAAFFGVLLGAPTLRLRGDYLAIVTLGFGQIIPIVFLNAPFFNKSFGLTALPPPEVTTPFSTINFGSYVDRSAFYYLELVLVVIVVFFVASLRNSSLGRAWVAIREDETAAAAAGINLVRTKLSAFGIGAGIGGLGGVIYTMNLTHVDPGSFVFNISIIILISVVLGGIGSIPGVIIGAILLQYFDLNLSGQITDAIQGSSLITSPSGPLHFLANFDFPDSKQLLYGIILVTMILLRPQGLIPNRRRQRELRGIGLAAEELSVVGEIAREESGETRVEEREM